MTMIRVKHDGMSCHTNPGKHRSSSIHNFYAKKMKQEFTSIMPFHASLLDSDLECAAFYDK